MLNVLNLTLDTTVLGERVKTYHEAHYWLDWFRTNCSDYEYVLVRWDHETEAYYCIH